MERLLTVTENYKKYIDDKEDLLQNTYKNVWKKIEIDEINGGYVYEVTKNNVLKFIEKQKQRRGDIRIATEQDIEQVKRSLSKIIDKNHLLKCIEEALLIIHKNNQDKAKEYLMYIEDRYFNDLSNKEIAKKYVIKEGKVTELFRKKGEMKIEKVFEIISEKQAISNFILLTTDENIT
jgi:DNA-directed RNA polymerase specialized sigma24 family protein